MMAEENIEILLRIGPDRRIVVSLDKNSPDIQSLHTTFEKISAEDEDLNATAQARRAVFRLYSKKFDEDVEIQKNHEFKDGQIVSVYFLPSPKEKETVDELEISRDSVQSLEVQSFDQVDQSQTLNKTQENIPLDRCNPEYFNEFELCSTTVEGGVCTAQEMRDPDSAYAAVTYALNSFDAYSPAHVAAISSLKQKAEEASVENDIESLMNFMADTLDAKIVLFQEFDKTLVFNPCGALHARVVFKPKSNHCDTCIKFESCAQIDIEKLPDPFLDIRSYFKDTQWKEMGEIDKNRYREIKKRYEYMLTKDIPIKMPDFMKPPSPKAQKKKAPLKEKVPQVASRTSERLQGVVRNYASAQDTSFEEDNPGRQTTDMDIGDDSDVEIMKSNSNVGNQEEERSNKENQPPKRSKQRKKSRTNKNSGALPVMGTNIKYPSPLPIFSAAALKQLQRPAKKRIMDPINEECRIFVRNLIGHERPSKTFYNVFCRTLVDEYPMMKDIDGTPLMYWATFKMSFRSSLRGKRSWAKNKSKRVRKTPKTQSNNNTDATSSDESDEEQSCDNSGEQVQADTQVREATEGHDRSALQRLLKASTQYRKLQRADKSPSENLAMYRHLKIPEMMICDYLLQENLIIDDIQTQFEVSVTQLGRHYEILLSSEVAKLQIVDQVHTHFLSREVKKGSQPVFILKNESEGIQHLSSTSIQAPYLVALTKQDFCTGEHHLRSASILMENRLVNTLDKPKAAQAVLLLVSAYWTLNAEYPTAYLDFMEALERVLTGRISHYARKNRKTSWNKFVALLK